MFVPGDLDFGRLFADALDAAPGGMLTEPGCRGQSPAAICVWPWRPSSVMSGPGDLRLFVAGLDAGPGGMLAAFREVLRLWLALEAELTYVWPWRPLFLCCGARR